MKTKTYQKRLELIRSKKDSNFNKLLPIGACLYWGSINFMDIAHYILYYDKVSFWLFVILGFALLTCYIMGVLLSISPTLNIFRKMNKKERLKDRKLWHRKSIWYTNSCIALFMIQAVFLFQLKSNLLLLMTP